MTLQHIHLVAVTLQYLQHNQCFTWGPEEMLLTENKNAVLIKIMEPTSTLQLSNFIALFLSCSHLKLS